MSAHKKQEFYYVCPKCWSLLVRNRTLVDKPRYICESCGYEFHVKYRISSELRKKFNFELKKAKDLLEGMPIYKIRIMTVCTKTRWI